MLVHAARQSRSRESHERLVDGALRLLDRQDWGEISIAAIAEAAGMSVGGFYARFASKDALLLVLHERYERRRTEYFLGLLDSKVEELPLPGRVAALVEATAEWMHRNRGVLRTFLLRFWSKPGEFDGAFGERLDAIYDRAVAVLVGDGSEIGHREPDRAVRLATVVLAATCREVLVLKPASGPGALGGSLRRFKKQMTEMVLCYLGAATEGEV